ncbi:hypothetical protein cyc_02641 [Cyclospora cayetanensis]|uniref:Uncharacterized protein n=1 Tax=Cyclospora cayetanensis TaxID=88456 RepID=A0A1D3CRN3_9EIME|nr:hypothetical protein cyc_02641 [Cyclospora cayetanensis]
MVSSPRLPPDIAVCMPSLDAISLFSKEESWASEHWKSPSSCYIYGFRAMRFWSLVRLSRRKETEGHPSAIAFDDLPIAAACHLCSCEPDEISLLVFWQIELKGKVSSGRFYREKRRNYGRFST